MSRKLRLLLLGVLGLLVGTGAVYYAVYVHSWLAMPEEPVESIERRWAEAARWAEAGPVGSTERLQNALTRLGRANDRLSELLSERGEGGALPRLERERLSLWADEALVELQAWHEQSGGLGPDLCLSNVSAVELLTLMRLALATANSEDQLASAEAALHLASALRRRGTFVHAVVGLTVAQEGLQWLTDRHLTLTAAMLGWRPTPEELFTAAARDAVCTVQPLDAPQAVPTGA